MRLEDRVAFACIFLSDTKLHDYIRQTCDALIEQGDLSGILLTGKHILLQRNLIFSFSYVEGEYFQSSWMYSYMDFLYITVTSKRLNRLENTEYR